MRDTRKTIFNVLLDNCVNFFSLAIIALLVVFIISKDYLYIIPLVLAVITLVINTVIDIKSYVIVKKREDTIHVLVNGEERETSFANLKIGDEVICYPNETIYFVGKVKSGVVCDNVTFYPMIRSSSSPADYVPPYISNDRANLI